MKAAPFAYHRPDTVKEAAELLGEYGDEAKILAGGHSLIPLMKLRLSEPGVLVDIGGLDGLRGIRRDNGSGAIGALTNYTAIGGAGELQGAEALTEAALAVGAAQVRNRGTIGGALCQADPSGRAGGRSSPGRRAGRVRGRG